MSKKQKKLIIDVDRAIEHYNKSNPKMRQMDRKVLADLCECNRQVFTDWKGGKTPKLIERLVTIKEATGCDLWSFIVPEDEL